MDADQTLKVIRETRDLLHKISPHKAKRYVSTKAPRGWECIEHIHWMLDEIERWILDQASMTAKKWEKVQRWLGFVQGALWSGGIYTIDEMRKQNASEVPTEGAPRS